MTRLEDLLPSAAVRGILRDQAVMVVGMQWFGSEALEVTYKAPSPTGPMLTGILAVRHNARA